MTSYLEESPDLGGGGIVDKRLVGRSFSRAAVGYDRVAELQRRVGDRLLTDLQPRPLAAERIIDVGAGTGYCTLRLAEVFAEAGLIALDLAEGMLVQLRRHPGLAGRSRFVCGDAESLPLLSGSVDLVFSNLALQWCPDLAAVLTGFWRVLRRGGRVAFSTFGVATLRELREAWATVDGYSHVHAFYPLHRLRLELAAAGFSKLEVRRSQDCLRYPSVDALMRELKGLGAHNLSVNRPRHLTGKNAMQKMMAAYTALMPDDQIRASFDIIYAYAWKD